MRYALNEQKDRVEVSFSKERAKCSNCNSEVIGRKGIKNRKHWAHKIKDCDNWYEPITDWHIKWQNYFPEKNREVTITENGKVHRADIQLDDLFVLEIQNSRIKPDDISAREDFYGKNGMLWILNGENLFKTWELKYKDYEIESTFEIILPNDLPNNPDYLSEKFLNDIFDIQKFASFKNQSEFKIVDNRITFKSYYTSFHLSQLETTQLKFYIVEIYQNYYFHTDVDKFRKSLSFNNSFKEINYREYYLDKKNRRSFIDQIEFPVYIDNIKGLNEENIFHYQDKKIIDKNEFIKEYLEQTKTGNNIG